MSEERRPAVLVVDDTPANLQVATRVLRAEYQALAATDGPTALAVLEQRHDVSLVLMDIMMPGMSGYEACRHIKENPRTAHIPVIFLTALSSPEDEQKAFEAGGVDFITKPFQPDTMMARVGTHIRLSSHELDVAAIVAERTASADQRAADAADARYALLAAAGRAAELREDADGGHVLRVGHSARLLAHAIGVVPADADLLLEAAVLHDLGKAALPDAVLLKPGPLTPEELAVVHQHPQHGADVLGAADVEPLATARLVALHHHERWDGSGYPSGLAGEAIPLSARIVGVADAFDAMTSHRAWREPLTPEEAVAALQAGAGTQFDPQLVEVFVGLVPEVLAIRSQVAGSPDVAGAAAAEADALAEMQAFRAR